jgi:hypothetical protein
MLLLRSFAGIYAGFCAQPTTEEAAAGVHRGALSTQCMTAHDLASFFDKILSCCIQWCTWTVCVRASSAWKRLLRVLLVLALRQQQMNGAVELCLLARLGHELVQKHGKNMAN